MKRERGEEGRAHRNRTALAAAVMAAACLVALSLARTTVSEWSDLVRKQVTVPVLTLMTYCSLAGLLDDKSPGKRGNCRVTVRLT